MKLIGGVSSRSCGRVYVERVHEIPDMGRAAKGRSIANLLESKHGEKVADKMRKRWMYQNYQALVAEDKKLQQQQEGR